ncbi:family 16 glycosylhydrolase [Sphingobacterium sp. DK4209]|uniref:Family 16 glycosylhydrolase n=2 Tax=Sphingobacterium zhuxiongii TaxID=2662364 RepID=A0A5Q0QB89_9SPHI|nr:family 16 glycosylhydrolase [Sphingobacterium sp. DK4209]QGA24948.1 family 16 glycosylhydrolase [Sphingobacterium sp. dk4302]
MAPPCSFVTLYLNKIMMIRTPYLKKRILTTISIYSIILLGLLNSLGQAFMFQANAQSKSSFIVKQESTENDKYELIWSDEFNTSGTFDSSKWSYADRGKVAWNKFLTSSERYVSLDGNNLNLRMDNAVIANDAVPYHSGGIQSKGKFSLSYGRVEVRAKFTQGRGSWPAIWMMPDPSKSYGTWPNCGEIDIMEHVNNESVIHHSIHNAKVTNANGGTTATKQVAYEKDAFNVYSIEWEPTSIHFFVNDVLHYTYKKDAGANWEQWPFDVPFYIILNQSGGAGWPGPITDADLPFSMQVDYVRVYKKPHH